MGSLALTFDRDSLRDLVRQVVQETMAELSQVGQQNADGRLAYSEAESAKMLGLEDHVLRDERRRGRITASQIVGRRIRYTREDLTEYLAARRVGAGT